MRARVLNDRAAIATDTVAFGERVNFCLITTQWRNQVHFTGVGDKLCSRGGNSLMTS